jgi:multisubunit Na+/H+ antiporter MnhB subunit
MREATLMSRISRSVIEKRSAVLIVYLRGQPRWLIAVLVAAVLLGGLFTGGAVSATLLIAMALVVSWLAYLSWPQTEPPARIARCVVVLALLALAVLRLVG